MWLWQIRPLQRRPQASLLRRPVFSAEALQGLLWIRGARREPVGCPRRLHRKKALIGRRP